MKLLTLYLKKKLEIHSHRIGSIIFFENRYIRASIGRNVSPKQVNKFHKNESRVMCHSHKRTYIRNIFLNDGGG